MSINAPLGATAEGGTFDVTASLVEPAQTLRRPRARTREARIGIAATVSIPVLALLVCIAGTRSPALVPQPIQLAPQVSGLTGPFQYIGFTMTVGEVVTTLVVLLGLYLVAVRYSERHVPARLTIAAIAVFTVIVMIGPPLFSTDVFSYQAYARMFAHYHANPYPLGTRW